MYLKVMFFIKCGHVQAFYKYCHFSSELSSLFPQQASKESLGRDHNTLERVSSFEEQMLMLKVGLSIYIVTSIETFKLSVVGFERNDGICHFSYYKLKYKSYSNK